MEQKAHTATFTYIHTLRRSCCLTLPAVDHSRSQNVRTHTRASSQNVRTHTRASSAIARPAHLTFSSAPQSTSGSRHHRLAQRQSDQYLLAANTFGTDFRLVENRNKKGGCLHFCCYVEYERCMCSEGKHRGLLKANCVMLAGCDPAQCDTIGVACIWKAHHSSPRS